jgi:hypothetical protein
VSQMLHIFRKDLRHLRLPLALWAGLLVARALVVVLAGTPIESELGRREMLTRASEMLSLLEVLFQAVVVARLFHEEAAVGLNAFWLTRPYRRGALTAAKLAVAAIALIAVPALRDSAILMVFGATAADLGRAAATTIISNTVSTLAFTVVAVLTPSLAGFVMAILGVVVAFVVVVVTTSTLQAFWMAAPSPFGRPSFTIDVTSQLMGTMLLVPAVIGIVRYQYWRRSWWRGAALALVCLIGLQVVSEQWPWRFARQREPQPDAWPASTRAVLVSDEPPNASRVQIGPRAMARHVNARVDLEGMPGQFQVQSIYTRGRLALDDGTTIGSAQTGRFTGQMLVGATTSVRTAVGVAVMEPSTEQSYTYAVWPALLQMSESDYTKHRGQRGRLDATLEFYLRRSRVVATLPLTLHATWNGAGVHAEIVRLEPQADGIDLQVRWWKIESPIRPRLGDVHELVLRNRRRSEAVGAGRTSNLAFRPARLPFGIDLLPAPGTMRVLELDFPARWEKPATPIRVDRDWLADAELAIVESTYGGRVTKDLAVDSFQVP